MTEISLPLGAASNRTKDTEENQPANEPWWNFTAYFCFAGCVSFGAIGLFLSGINYFIAPGGVGFKIGTILVFAALPLMLFGAHALDKVEENAKKDK